MKKFYVKKEKKIKNNKINNNTHLLASFLKANSHYGTPTKTLNINNSQYLYGIRSKQAVINLHHTIQSVRRSFLLIEKILRKRKMKPMDHKILIVCNETKTKLFQQHFQSVPFAKQIKYIHEDWVGGFITNPQLLQKRLKNIRLIIALNGTRDNLLINAARIASIPLISVVDTNINTNLIPYPIVMNTTKSESIFFFMFLLKKYLSHLKL